MNKIITKCLLGFILASLLGFATSAFAVLPPWYLYHNQLKAVLEGDSCIYVGEVTGAKENMEMLVNVCNYNKALALSSFISKKHTYGNASLDVKVMTSNQLVPATSLPNDLHQLQILVTKAFFDNKYFSISYVNVIFGVGERVFVELKPDVIQYFSDDQLDFYHRTNLVAQVAFQEALDFPTTLMLTTTATKTKA